MAALRDAIKRVNDGEDARAAVAAAARRLVARVRARLARLHGRAELQDVPGHRHPDRRTSASRRAIASGRKPSEEDALSSTLKASAPFRHLRLGNMLLKRDRPRAAVAEYEKGAKAVAASGRAARGDPSAAWVFPVKLGRTYLALGEPDRALKALAPVQALYPDLPWPQPDRGRGAGREGRPGGGAGPAARRRWPPTRSTRASTARWPTPTPSSPRQNNPPPPPSRASRGSAAASPKPSDRPRCCATPRDDTLIAVDSVSWLNILREPKI